MPATPVLTDDLVAGATRFLLAQPSVVALVGSSGDPATPLIVQGAADSAPEPGEWDQSAAVIVSYAGGWAGAEFSTSWHFPRLQIALWVDALRDGDGAVAEPAETRRRLMALYAAVDQVLHRPSGGVGAVMFGDVRTTSCERLGELSMYAVPGGDGALRGLVFYAVSQG